MTNIVNITGTSTTTTIKATITAAAGSAGTALAYTAKSSRMVLTNTSATADFEYKIGSGAWRYVGRNGGAVETINFTVDALLLRKTANDSSLCTAEICVDSVPGFGTILDAQADRTLYGAVLEPIGALGRRVVQIGDSILGQAYTAEFPANCDPTILDTTISARSTRSRGILPVLNALMGMPFLPVYYGAVTGTTTNTILASAANIFNRNFDMCFEDGGTNDISLFVTEWVTLAAAEAGVVANRQAVWAKAIAAGAKCIVALAIPPVGASAGWTTAQKAAACRINAALAKAAAQNACIRWIDLHEPLVDSTLSTGLMKTSVLWDSDKHPGSYGAYLIARKIMQDAWIASMAIKRPMLSSQLDCIQNDTSSKNLLNASVGLATGATGASGGTGSSGTILNGITTNRVVGTPSTVASIVAAPNGVGNAQRLVVTSGALNDQVRALILPGSTLTEFPRGSWGYFECLCQVTSATNFLAVTVTAGATWVGGSLSSQTAVGLSLPNTGETGSAYTNSDILTLVSEPFYMPTDITSLTFNKGELFFTFSDVGGATFDIYQMRWVKL